MNEHKTCEEKGIWDYEFISKKEIHTKLREISHQYGSHCAVDKQAAVHRCMDAIMEITPTEVVPVVHGRWMLKHIGAGHYWECSVCHENPCIYVTKNTKFCPNCGAKMDMKEG